MHEPFSFPSLSSLSILSYCNTYGLSVCDSSSKEKHQTICLHTLHAEDDSCLIEVLLLNERVYMQLCCITYLFGHDEIHNFLSNKLMIHPSTIHFRLYA